MANPLDQVASWPATAAAGVVSAAGLLASAGPAERPYRWASVTKLLVALAALDAVQRGLFDLDEPAGPPGSTIRHLLSHASGLGLNGDAILSRPGRQRIYSNRGIEIVADNLAARSGQPFERLLADEICLPLGMTGTRLEGSPAWGAVGPLRDLMTLAIELVSPELVREDLLAEATQTAFPGLPGVLPGFGRQPRCDWGLGFEIRDSKEPHWTGSANSARTFGHFGGSGSFLWVDPEARIACASLADRDFGDWAKQAWPRLSDDVLASYAGADLSSRSDCSGWACVRSSRRQTSGCSRPPRQACGGRNYPAGGADSRCSMLASRSANGWSSRLTASASAVATVPDAASPRPAAAAPWPRPSARACQYSIPASEAVTVRLARRSSAPRPRSIFNYSERTRVLPVN
ncbi:MAG: serine hydrolase domain-containing protein [Streptosporangiaceae bacterium]